MKHFEEARDWVNDAENKVIDDFDSLVFKKVQACIEKMQAIKEKEILSLENKLKAAKIKPKDKKKLISLIYNTFDEYIRDEFS